MDRINFQKNLLPLFINNIRQGKKLPVYGDGNFTRDWLLLKIMQKLLIKFIIMVKKEKHIILEALMNGKILIL